MRIDREPVSVRKATAHETLNNRAFPRSARLNIWRGRLRGTLAESPVCDGAAFAAAMQDAWRRVVGAAAGAAARG